VESSYNSQAAVQRDLKALKAKFKRLKGEAKKKAAQLRRPPTGGGKRPRLSLAEEQIIDMYAGTTAFNGVDGGVDLYGDFGDGETDDAALEESVTACEFEDNVDESSFGIPNNRKAANATAGSLVNERSNHQFATPQTGRSCFSASRVSANGRIGSAQSIFRQLSTSTSSSIPTSSCTSSAGAQAAGTATRCTRELQFQSPPSTQPKFLTSLMTSAINYGEAENTGAAKETVASRFVISRSALKRPATAQVTKAKRTASVRMGSSGDLDAQLCERQLEVIAKQEALIEQQMKESKLNTKLTRLKLQRFQMKARNKSNNTDGNGNQVDGSEVNE
jgi:hypothetical protein